MAFAVYRGNTLMTPDEEARWRAVFLNAFLRVATTGKSDDDPEVIGKALHSLLVQEGAIMPNLDGQTHRLGRLP
jgi:hypothetical protein